MMVEFSPAYFLQKYGPMLPQSHKPETVSFLNEVAGHEALQVVLRRKCGYFACLRTL